MQVSPSVLYENCYGRYAIAAINVWCMEQIHALFRAARKAEAPFIVQITPAAMKYGHMDMLISMIKTAAAIYPGNVYAVHLDHGTREIVMKVLPSGVFNSVMIDASHESFDENIRTTQEVVQHAHNYGISVEAELGVLSGVEDELEVGAESGRYTRPEEVEQFVSQTGCDSLAVAVGTSHGAYKFSGKQSIRFEILEAIQHRVPQFPLVLHGGSAIPGEEIERINQSGGMLKTTSRGVSREEIRKSLQFGICKVNIATDARVIWTRVHREFFKFHPEQFDPINPGKTYMDELEKLYIGKFQLLNATSKLKDLQP